MTAAVDNSDTTDVDTYIIYNIIHPDVSGGDFDGAVITRGLVITGIGDPK